MLIPARADTGPQESSGRCGESLWLSHIKKTQRPEVVAFFRGSNQTRTGVNGFADRYLTTRTWNPFVAAKLVQIFESAKFSSQFSGKISGKNLVRLIIQCGAVLLSGRRCSVIGAALFCYRGGAVPLSGRRCSIIRAALFCYPGGAVLLSGRRCSVIGAELFRYRGGAVPLSGRSCSVIRAALFRYRGGAVPLSGRSCSVIRRSRDFISRSRELIPAPLRSPVRRVACRLGWGRRFRPAPAGP